MAELKTQTIGAEMGPNDQSMSLNASLNTHITTAAQHNTNTTAAATSVSSSNSASASASASLIDGVSHSKDILSEVAAQVQQVLSLSDSFKPPHLAVVIVGDRKDSAAYVKKKVQACEKVGIKSSTFHLSANSTTAELLELVDELNHADDTDGILVQLPLPESIDEKLVIRSIDYRKDVDGLHPYNMGCLAQSRNPAAALPSSEESKSNETEKVNSIGVKDTQPQSERLFQNIKQYLSPNCSDYFTPCTAEGIIELLVRSQVPIAGSQVTVVGRSSLVGLPVSLLLQKRDATVTMCHSKTRNLQFHCLNADILVVAIGRPNFIKADWVKEGAVVIDVGINAVDDSSCRNGYRLCGDVEFKSVKQKCSKITPVPGGVGPMTVSILMRNAVKSWLRRLTQRQSGIDGCISNGCTNNQPLLQCVDSHLCEGSVKQ